MRLWLLCCALLFVAAQIYDWMSHQAWLTAELSLPWVILGGVGLAIASNRSLLKPILHKPSPILHTPSSSPVPSPQGSPVVEVNSQNLQSDPAIATPPPATHGSNTSISFEISQEKRSQA